jgi:hypothetical protein
MVLCYLCCALILTIIFTFCADTCRPRDTDSESDKELLPAKKQRRNLPPPIKVAAEHFGIEEFHMKMAAVIGLRGMQRGDNFELYTDIKDDGTLHEIEYRTGDQQYFLQLVHASNPGTAKLVHSELVPLLHQCFEKYNSMENKRGMQFIIYTNKHLGKRLLQHEIEEVDDMNFKTSDRGKAFKFIQDTDKEIDVYTLVEKSVMKSKEYSHLRKPEKECKLKKVKEFLKNLIIFTGQKDSWELDDEISKEIRKEDANEAGPEKYHTVLHHFNKKLETWWKRKKEMTPEMLRKWLREAKTASRASVAKRWFNTYKKNLVKTGIKFSDSEISWLKTELSNKHAVHLRSDALTLCSKLLLDCLATSECIFVTFELLQSNKNKLLHAWLGGHWEWLIVCCDSRPSESDISDTCLEISDIIKADPSRKRAIILTSSSVQEIRYFAPLQHKFTFGQLSKKSQEMVLEKEIDFHGLKVKMKSVLNRNTEHSLGPQLLTHLMTEEKTVKFRGTLQEHTAYYEPRPAKKKIYLQVDVLKNPDSYPDIFAVSGIEEKALVKIVSSYETVEVFRLHEDPTSGNWKEIYNEFKRSRFILLRSKNLKFCFLKLYEKHSGKTLHWVEFESGNLLWKGSVGGVDNLLDYVDTERNREKNVTYYMKSCGR